MTSGPRPDRLAPDEVAVGQPLLPDPALFAELTSSVWESGWLTNGGPLHHRLEREVGTLLGSPATTALTSSGTTALMLLLALHRLPVGSEVVTTPGSFAATARAIEWMGLRPVFADVDPQTWCLDPDAVEEAISPRTGAILGVHLFGVVGDHVGIDRVAQEHGIPVLYDAAHAFGVEVDGVGVGLLGAGSAFSLHATKLMHTGEGGVVTSPRPDDQAELGRLRNFGRVAGAPVDAGINGKLPETSAALGLAVLPRLQAERDARRRLRAAYDEIMRSRDDVTTQDRLPGTTPSELFYPVRLPVARKNELARLLRRRGIHARSELPLLCGPGTRHPDAVIVAGRPRAVAADIADEVLALPMHGRVTDEHVEIVAEAMATL